MYDGGERKYRHRGHILRKVDLKEALLRPVNGNMKTSQIKCILFHGLHGGRNISLTGCLSFCRPIFKNLAYIPSFSLPKNPLAYVLLCPLYRSENWGLEKFSQFPKATIWSESKPKTRSRSDNSNCFLQDWKSYVGVSSIILSHSLKANSINFPNVWYLSFPLHFGLMSFPNCPVMVRNNSSLSLDTWHTLYSVFRILSSLVRIKRDPKKSSILPGALFKDGKLPQPLSNCYVLLYSRIPSRKSLPFLLQCFSFLPVFSSLERKEFLSNEDLKLLHF